MTELEKAKMKETENDDKKRQNRIIVISFIIVVSLFVIALVLNGGYVFVNTSPIVPSDDNLESYNPFEADILIIIIITISIIMLFYYILHGRLRVAN